MVFSIRYSIFYSISFRHIIFI